MSSERKISHIAEIDRSSLSDQEIVVCDASHIRCKHLGKLRKIFDLANSEIVVVMPESDLVEGSSGFAKAQILENFIGVKRIIGATEHQMKQILDQGYGNVISLGPITFTEESQYFPNCSDNNNEISTTEAEKHKYFMSKVFDLIPESNCWWKPNACAFVRGTTVLTSAVSSNPWCSECKALNINSSQVKINPGERIDFCDAIHAERLAVSKAAKYGVALDDSSVYITSFPCEECSKVLVASGVETVYFKNDSYGLKDADLLTKNGINFVRVKY